MGDLDRGPDGRGYDAGEALRAHVSAFARQLAEVVNLRCEIAFGLQEAEYTGHLILVDDREELRVDREIDLTRISIWGPVPASRVECPESCPWAGTHRR